MTFRNINSFGYGSHLGLGSIGFSIRNINDLRITSLRTQGIRIDLRNMKDNRLTMSYRRLSTDVRNINDLALDKGTGSTRVSGSKVNDISAQELGINRWVSWLRCGGACRS